jgi:hypothetical protein
MAKKGMGTVTKLALGTGVVALGVYAVWKLFLSKPEDEMIPPTGDGGGLTQNDGGSYGTTPTGASRQDGRKAEKPWEGILPLGEPVPYVE